MLKPIVRLPGADMALVGQGLWKAYGAGPLRTVVLADASLEVDRGEFVLLMGPSGSGKSTLLAVLAGLVEPDRGRVSVFGTDLLSLSDRGREAVRRENFGFVFQGHNLFPALTALQQLALPLQWGAAVGRGEALRRAAEMLDFLGLGDRMHLRPAQLSGGEKQRVSIGRALVNHPRLCFADEPTSALDWEHGRVVLDLLRDAARVHGSTVVVVSHDDRVIPLADRVFLIRDGHLTGGDRRITV